MNRGVLLVGALAAGFVGGFAGGFVASPPPPTPTVPGAADADLGGGGAATAADLARLRDRVDALAAQLRSDHAATGRARAPGSAGDTSSRETAPAAGETIGAGGGPATDGTATDAPPANAADPGTLDGLARRVAALEAGRPGAGGPLVPDDFATRPVGEVQALLATLQSAKRHEDALRVAESLAQRGELTADGRTDAELSVGYALRALGRHAAAETRFRDTLTRVGESSSRGADVMFQLGWERYFQGDLAGAAVQMQRTADHPEASPILRVHALYNGGRFAQQAGDPARARELLERLLRDHKSDIPVSQAYLSAEAERLLKEIDGK